MCIRDRSRPLWLRQRDLDRRQLDGFDRQRDWLHLGADLCCRLGGGAGARASALSVRGLLCNSLFRRSPGGIAARPQPELLEVVSHWRNRVHIPRIVTGHSGSS